MIEQSNRNRSNDFKETFTKDYVTELKNIHLKEKNELLFKISSLENTLNRLKNAFGEHINKMQETVDDNSKESNKIIKELEEENEFKFRKMENDKTLEISILRDESNNLKRNNNDLLTSIKNLEEEKNLIQLNLTNQINELNQQISNIKMEAENNQRNSNELYKQMKSEYDNKMNSILSEREREINDMIIKHKFEIENLNNELLNLKKDNFGLKELIEQNEKKYCETLNELQNENCCLHKEIQFIQEQNNLIFNKYKNTEQYLFEIQNENDIHTKNIEKQREEIHNKGKEIQFLNNNNNSLKNSNDYLEEMNQKLQRDNNELKCQNENMNYEFSSKLKNLNYIENQNCILTRENNELKNKIEKLIRSYSFNSNC